MNKVEPKFVEFMPEKLDEGILYISLAYKTMMHKCACGCGVGVNTPLSPAGWSLKYDGKSITLNPSIGNWEFDCKSHYWIKNNTIEWARKWNDDEISINQANDRLLQEEVFSNKKPNTQPEVEELLSKHIKKKWYSFLKFW